MGAEKDGRARRRDPSRVSLPRALSFLRPLLLSACYAGYQNNGLVTGALIFSNANLTLFNVDAVQKSLLSIFRYFTEAGKIDIP